MRATTKTLLVMEVEVDDEETAREQIQQKLDAFREAVQPSSEYGITLSLATTEDVNEFAKAGKLLPEPGSLVKRIGRKLTITIEADTDIECPCDEDGAWKLYSFNHRHTNFKEPTELLPPDAKLKKKLTDGLAFILSYFEHGQSAWMIKGGEQWQRCPDKQWDGVEVAGLLVWEEPASHMGAKTYEARQKDAESFLETYNDWANGNCHWYKIEDDTGHVIDECGGYIGEDSLLEAIREQIDPDDEIEEVTGDGAWICKGEKLIPDRKEATAHT